MKAEITFEKGLATTNQAVSKSSVEIILGDVYKGKDGDSAYKIAVENGFVGSEQDWLDSLKVTTDAELNAESNNAIANSAVTGAITELEDEKLNKPSSTDESVNITDKNNNVGFKVDKDGLKSRKYHIVSPAGDVIYTIDAEYFEALKKSISVIEESLSRAVKIGDSDTSFDIVDASNNIGLRIDKDGAKMSVANFVDKTGNVVSKIKKDIDGYVICDANNNIIFKIDADGVKARKYNLVNSAGDVTNTLDANLFMPAPKQKVILFNFDGTNDDSRPDVLFKYGFQGTFSQPSSVDIFKKLIQQGHEICPYTNGCRNLSYDEEGVQQAIAKLTTVFNDYFYKYGLYQPSTLLCDGHEFSWPLKEALIRMNLLQYFRYIRCATVRDEESNATYPAYGTMDGNGYYLLPQGIANLGNNAEEVITKIDDFIDNKESQDGRQYLMLFMHNYLYDDVNDGPWIDEAAFEQIVAHVKSRVDNGDVLVKNLEQYYTYYHPQEGVNDNLSRVRLAILNNLITQ